MGTSKNVRVGSFVLAVTIRAWSRDQNQKPEGLAFILFVLHGRHQSHDYAGCLLTAGLNTRNRWKLYVRFFSPILAHARTRPMVRISLPPIAVT